MLDLMRPIPIPIPDLSTNLSHAQVAVPHPFGVLCERAGGENAKAAFCGFEPATKVDETT